MTGRELKRCVEEIMEKTSDLMLELPVQPDITEENETVSGGNCY